MKNSNLKTICRIMLICCLSIFITNCEGEDGAIGPTGENGIDGTNGTDGNNGANGVNGLGFDELVKYGNITLTLEGTRPDNDESFTDTSEFEFIQRSSSNWFNTGESYIDYEFIRFLNTPDPNRPTPSVRLTLGINNLGEENQELNLHTNINNYPVLLDDLSFFSISGNHSKRSLGVGNFSVSNYSFNEETRNLIFSFSYTVAPPLNATGKLLTVSGEVNVILFKNTDLIR